MLKSEDLMKLLRIDSSARRNSVSRQLTQKFVDTWKKEHPGGQVIERDLTTTSLPLITDEWTLAAYSDPASLTPAQRETLSVSDTLVDELLAADAIVIGAPMYNLTVSAPLKAWIDQIVRVGRTVLYGASGAQGVLKGKKMGGSRSKFAAELQRASVSVDAAGPIVFLGRVLFALIFLMSGPMHFSSQTIAYAASQGVPLASIAVPFSGVLAIVGGLSILLGYRAKIGAWLIAVFLVVLRPFTIFVRLPTCLCHY